MKYSIKENENGTHTLMRYDEGHRQPNSAEYEFWCEIRELREKIVKLKKKVELCFEEMETLTTPWYLHLVQPSPPQASHILCACIF